MRPLLPATTAPAGGTEGPPVTSAMLSKLRAQAIEVRRTRCGPTISEIITQLPLPPSEGHTVSPAGDRRQRDDRFFSKDSAEAGQGSSWARSGHRAAGPTTAPELRG